MPSLILASSSPQRKTLLQGLGVPFEVLVSTLAESGHPEKDPAKRAQILAEEKAAEVAHRMPGNWVIGCDTLVTAPDGSLLEKPIDVHDAERMLRLQSGGASTVHSGLCVLSPKGERFTGLSSSTVHFKQLSDAEVAWWMHTKLWDGRSGSFQIDGPGQLMIERIEGDWSSIVGLPVFLLGQLLEQAGYSFR